ncbi:DUF4179 domain-containing protein [Paenibacillus macquariensis]|uniref:Tat pathway signal protein n=1 Tax=Paenibacillus macquariensis TaxID=948756 RepID=A0ABY1K3T5_9BACL|nr:DUF4179 domain-containing protein [Paenibacillus macquariensis]MEC0088900.1 DUF4179 domain-containing protein [Paenibacillus macquariensis]OAB31954.1 Tat pathway signal protein [Paenibacillus macquariensis subsp. macquariensis]SIR22343.1 protein of unknown function [Paenibacillus macquariensis]
MVHLPNQTESKEMDTIEQWIRNSEMPRVSMSHQIMNKIGDQTMSKTKSNFVRKTLVTVSAAAVLGVGVIGTGFVSPAMADTLKQIPVIGSVFSGISDERLQTAIDQGIATSPNLSVTHDGVTLKVTDLLYDGTVLKFEVEREGVELPSTFGSHQDRDKGEVKGYIQTPTLLVNGKEIKYTSGGFGDIPYKENTIKAEIRDGMSLPDQFELTIQAKVTQIEEPFEFKIPVKIENNMLVLKPNATETDGKFSYTVKQLEITPASTRLILDSTGDVPKTPEQTGDYSATMVYYDIVDDQGNEINQDRVGFFNSKPETEYHVNELYQAFAATPKSITIKPYTFTVNTSDWKIVGASNGIAGDKTYLDDLELTIPVQP